MTGMTQRKRSFPARFLRFGIKCALYFIGISVALVIIFKFLQVPITATMMRDNNGAVREWTPLNEISANMAAAVIAAEDSKFCSHDGFDREAIEKAIAYNKQGGRIRGGSTISQQTAKNVFLWQGGGFFRKGLEAWFTFLIEKIWGKPRIMEVYLNVAETGVGTYGAEAGAQRYFKKPVKQLTRVEAARIAAALPQPKTRGVANARGFTRRYGNIIAARINIVRRDGLNDCVTN
mgnify:CR=1 FL=1